MAQVSLQTRAIMPVHGLRKTLSTDGLHERCERDESSKKDSNHAEMDDTMPSRRRVCSPRPKVPPCACLGWPNRTSACPPDPRVCDRYVLRDLREISESSIPLASVGLEVPYLLSRSETAPRHARCNDPDNDNRSHGVVGAIKPINPTSYYNLLRVAVITALN
jgi:hypothetical protein